MELSFATRCFLFYDGLMDWIGANLFIVWPFFAFIMAIIFIKAMTYRR